MMHLPITEQEIVENRGKNRFSSFKDKDKDVFNKAYTYTTVELAKRLDCYPYYQTIEYCGGSTATIDGKECITLGSNNYLGLTSHPEVRKAATDAINEYGTSMTGSRLLNGSHVLHEKLEESMADFIGKDSCVVTTTGYQANLAIISGLIGENDSLILDKANHASIHDGACLTTGEKIYFKHDNLESLIDALDRLTEDGGRLIFVDGVFSMEGNICPLPDIVKLARRYNARVVVDDAHSIGVIGVGGRGTASHFGLNNDIDLIMGTFSKSLASIGGFIAGDSKVISFIKHYGRSLLFSASLPPACAAAALKALEILKREPQRVDRLNSNADYLRSGLKSLGFNLTPSETPIIGIVIGDDLQVALSWRKLLDQGVYVNCVMYPAVPEYRSMIRTSLSSEHTQEQLDKALDVFKLIKDDMQV